MKPLDWIAFAVLALQSPIPFFWLLVHPFIGFWRRYPRWVYKAVFPVVWLSVGAFLQLNREAFFSSASTPLWMVVLGLALILIDLVLFVWAHRTLGTHRFIGAAELAERRDFASSGPYALIRHPRYSGMMAAVLGAGLIAASPFLWIFLLAWFVFALIAIRFEEREMLDRFGQAYVEYSARVPALLPFRRRR